MKDEQPTFTSACLYHAIVASEAESTKLRGSQILPNSMLLGEQRIASFDTQFEVGAESVGAATSLLIVDTLLKDLGT